MSENSSPTTKFVAERFRFVELLLIVLVGIITQVIWVSFSPIVDETMVYYGVDEISITILAASFMVLYIPINNLSTKSLDKYGLKKGVGIGIILTAVGGLIRAVGGRNYWVCLTGQIIAAIGQPFVLNSFTKLSANWFLESEKTTAAGIGSISLFLGVIIAMLLPDMLGPSSIELMLWIYAILGLIIMVLFLVFAKDKPESPPNKYADKERFAKIPGGMKELFKNKDFTILSIMVFIGLGIFNAITTVIDLIFTDAIYPGIVSGNVSAFMIFGGILGAVIISAISDKMHKRKIFLIIAFVGGVFLSLLLAVFRDPNLVYIISLIFGFILVSSMPIGTTYGAEITYPIPEEQSNGILMTAGQISGLIFLVFPMELFLFISAGIFAIGAVLSFLIHDTDWYESKRASS